MTQSYSSSVNQWVMYFCTSQFGLRCMQSVSTHCADDSILFLNVMFVTSDVIECMWSSSKINLDCFYDMTIDYPLLLKQLINRFLEVIANYSREFITFKLDRKTSHMISIQELIGYGTVQSASLVWHHDWI